VAVFSSKGALIETLQLSVRRLQLLTPPIFNARRIEQAVWRHVCLVWLVQVLFFAEDEDDAEKSSTTRSIESTSTNGTTTPDTPQPVDSPRRSPRPTDHHHQGASIADASKESVLKNIFTSLSEAGAAAGNDETRQPQHHQPAPTAAARTVKHVRLMDMVEHIERHDDDDDYS